MAIPASLCLIALGAVMAFAGEATVAGIAIHSAGVIVMVLGAISLALAMLFWTSFAPFGGEVTTVDEPPDGIRRPDA